MLGNRRHNPRDADGESRGRNLRREKNFIRRRIKKTGRKFNRLSDLRENPD